MLVVNFGKVTKKNSLKTYAIYMLLHIRYSFLALVLTQLLLVLLKLQPRKALRY